MFSALIQSTIIVSIIFLVPTSDVKVRANLGPHQWPRAGGLLGGEDRSARQNPRGEMCAHRSIIFGILGGSGNRSGNTTDDLELFRSNFAGS